MPSSDSSDEQRFAGALLARAEGDRRRLVRAATEDAQRLLEEAEGQIARLRAERLQAAVRRARIHIDHQLSAIRQEQRAEEARLLDDARAQVIESAERELAAIRQRPEYDARLRAMLDHVVNELGTETPLTLIVDQRDRAPVDAILRTRGLKEIKVVAGGPFLGGFQASTRDGQSTIDHTFDARLRARRSSIHVQLARIIARSD